jgi:hypothetical protein
MTAIVAAPLFRGRAHRIGRARAEIVRANFTRYREKLQRGTGFFKGECQKESLRQRTN